MSKTSLKQVKPVLPGDRVRQNANFGPIMPSENSKAAEIMNGDSSVLPSSKYANESETCSQYNNNKGNRKTEHGSGDAMLDRKASVVFKGKYFQFSSSFPEERVSCYLFSFRMDYLYFCGSEDSFQLFYYLT